MGDRAFAFVRTSGPKGFPWHTGREQEDLVLFRPHFREGGATTLPPDIEETFKMAPGVNPIFPAEDAFEIDVGTPDGRTLPLRSPELKAMIEQRAGYAVTLRFSERSLYDCRPVSLFGNASAKGLGDELARLLLDAVLETVRGIVVDVGKAIAAAPVGRYAAHALFPHECPAGSARQRGP